MGLPQECRLFLLCLDSSHTVEGVSWVRLSASCKCYQIQHKEESTRRLSAKKAKSWFGKSQGWPVLPKHFRAWGLALWAPWGLLTDAHIPYQSSFWRNSSTFLLIWAWKLVSVYSLSSWKLRQTCWIILTKITHMIACHPMINLIFLFFFFELSGLSQVIYSFQWNRSFTVGSYTNLPNLDQK